MYKLVITWFDSTKQEIPFESYVKAMETLERFKRDCVDHIRNIKIERR